jgi:hypothetical protein
MFVIINAELPIIVERQMVGVYQFDGQVDKIKFTVRNNV